MIVTDGFTGNVALKLLEGVSQTMLERGPRARRRRSPRAKLGGALLRPGAARSARRDRPRGAGRRLPARACAGSASCRTGASRATASSQAILLAARGVSRRRRRAHPRGARGGGRAAAAGPTRRPETALRCRASHDPRGGLPLIRDHLADELDIDPTAIDEETRFKEDLEADSLDLYTLVQELEDTYGVTMSDEQAAQILTVGQAVDFVLAHARQRGR